MSWVHNDGHISVSGTSVPRTEAKSEVRECHTRKATPEELERYFGGRDKIKPAPAEPPKAKTISKDELLERLHPTHKESGEHESQEQEPEPEESVPEPEPEPDEPEPEPEESVPDESEISALNDIVAAAHKVSEKKYKAMKAAVIAIGLANGWE
jgi:hypothetical protein